MSHLATWGTKKKDKKLYCWNGRQGKADLGGLQKQEHKRMQVSKSLKGKKKRKESSM